MLAADSAPHPKGAPERVATAIRDLLIAGTFRAGEKLSEQQIATRFNVSRNTLREAFRQLIAEGLLDHIAHRGVRIAVPDPAAVMDIYRLRRVVQAGAIRAAWPGHPALVLMRGHVLTAQTAHRLADWPAVGTANMAFHRAMVALCDSPRLSNSFDRALAELRLAFGLANNHEPLHAPFVALNARLAELIATGDTRAALRTLDHYLTRSEQAVMAALPPTHPR